MEIMELTKPLVDSTLSPEEKKRNDLWFSKERRGLGKNGDHGLLDTEKFFGRQFDDHNESSSGFKFDIFFEDCAYIKHKIRRYSNLTPIRFDALTSAFNLFFKGEQFHELNWYGTWYFWDMLILFKSSVLNI